MRASLSGLIRHARIVGVGVLCAAVVVAVMLAARERAGDGRPAVPVSRHEDGPAVAASRPLPHWTPPEPMASRLQDPLLSVDGVRDGAEELPTPRVLDAAHMPRRSSSTPVLARSSDSRATLLQAAGVVLVILWSLRKARRRENRPTGDRPSPGAEQRVDVQVLAGTGGTP
jgi:hypothetical protein